MLAEILQTRYSSIMSAVRITNDEMHRQLRITAAEEGLTIQEIVETAIYEWFAKRGKEIRPCGSQPLPGQSPLPLSAS